MGNRQWPKVYDLCYTFLDVARVKQHTAMRESHVFLESVVICTAQLGAKTGYLGLDSRL